MPQGPWRADLYLNSSKKAKGSSHGNTGEVLAALIINSAKLTPKGTSLLLFAFQKRKWIYISRNRLLSIFLLYKWIVCFPFKYNFPKKNIGKLSMHTQNVPKAERNYLCYRKHLFLSEDFSSPCALVRYSKMQNWRHLLWARSHRILSPRTPKDWDTPTDGQSRLYSQEWGILAVHAAHVGLWFQLSVFPVQCSAVSHPLYRGFFLPLSCPASTAAHWVVRCKQSGETAGKRQFKKRLRMRLCESRKISHKTSQKPNKCRVHWAPSAVGKQAEPPTNQACV